MGLPKKKMKVRNNATVAENNPNSNTVDTRAANPNISTEPRRTGVPIPKPATFRRVIPRPLIPEFRISVRRPDDHLVFDIVFENLQLDGSQPPNLIKKNPDATAFMIVEFPPQSFAEQVFTEKPPEIVPPLPSAKIRMAGRSRVAFTMPDSLSSIPYTLQGILQAFRTWLMQLDSTAAPEPTILFKRVEKVGTFDRAWFKSLTSSPSWKQLKSSYLTAAVSNTKEVDTAISKAAERIAATVAANLAAGKVANLNRLIASQMDTEMNAIAASNPQLRQERARTAATSALSVATAEALAASQTRFAFDLTKIAVLPFLPLLLSPHAPNPDVTALELPYRIILSPIMPSRWLHKDTPVEHDGRTELWHTRLTTAQNDFGPDAPAKVRAIWSPDYEKDPPNPGPNPSNWPWLYKTSIKPWNPNDRKNLVLNMAGFTEQVTKDLKKYHAYTPHASRANRLHLTSLGALLDVEGSWNQPLPQGGGLNDLVGWKHQSTLGRDQYVKTAHAGFLYPFGHGAVYITITERKFESVNGDVTRRIAVLRQRSFIVVSEPVKEFNGSNHRYKGNNFPFISVEIITRTTADLVSPDANYDRLKLDPQNKYGIYTDGTVKAGQELFWPMVSAGEDFFFNIAATDLNGNRVTFSMPLLFIGAAVNQLTDKVKCPACSDEETDANKMIERIDQISAAYNDDETKQRRLADLAGATVCFAPRKLDPNSDPKGDPQLPCANILFKAGYVNTKSAISPNFYPEIQTTSVGIRAVQKLLQQPNAVIDMSYADVFRDNNFDGPNVGEVFLQAIQGFPLNFGAGADQPKSDMLGALATPQMVIEGLSRIIGPAADLDKIAQKIFNPADFFKDAKILGGISIADILEIVTELTGENVPKLLSRELPDKVEAKFDWKTEIKKSDPLGLFVPNADTNKSATALKMHGNITTPLRDPEATSYEAWATLNNFKVNLFGFIIVWFEDLKFTAEKGKKPDVTVNLREGEDAVQFGGPLEFVNQLRKYIPSNAFSDPPDLSITPSGIQASYSLNLPTISVGIFALSNVSISAGFSLPFDSSPALVRFNFSERQSPFSLTVYMLGGGGFFAIAVASSGVKEIEAALEFGAKAKIDLGVASGGVEIKAGIYFHWLGPDPNNPNGFVELEGYVRLHGELSVLGLISASLTFNMQLAYEKAGTQSKVWGEATLVVEIDLLFFSIDVSVSCRREFAGGESDPSFEDLMPKLETWETYCNAFAEEVP